MSIKGINSSMSSIFPVVFHKKQSIEEKNMVLLGTKVFDVLDDKIQNRAVKTEYSKVV